MSSVGALRCRADFCLLLRGEGGVSWSASVSEGSLSPCWDPVSPINSLRNLNLDKNNCQTTYQPAGERKKVTLSYSLEIDSQLSVKLDQESEKKTFISPHLLIAKCQPQHISTKPLHSFLQSYKYQFNLIKFVLIQQQTFKLWTNCTAKASSRWVIMTAQIKNCQEKSNFCGYT